MAGRSYVLQDQIGHLLRRAHQRATQIFLETFEQAGLTPTQWAALAMLAEEGAASQNALGRMTAMDPATIQGVIRRLEERGLITREPDPDDKRRTKLRLSEEGEALVHEVTSLGTRVTERTLAPIDPEDRRKFLEMLAKLS
ncbi:MarR family transcriptional regulator [Thalassobaculum sp. OXR-137]|uniref:MarR family winged helix-turn-helix transcriptional regulator n=1 Tax=Thalassobaculum sp. OXR-137 TaxID=3100173 RepID=UPI002AC91E82|nr:MarR family transcriptional regulator [Thalassobaculum sp. OXR-137]WPZ36504.1 MarR family transcriptional regulator [Thalassobaculum sp. OXR-137]